MIDAREEVVSSAPSKSRRSSAPAPTRAVKPGAPKKGLKVERVFSDPRVKPFDQIGFISPDLDKGNQMKTAQAGVFDFFQHYH